MFVIYGQPNCQWCERSKELLDTMNIEWEYKNVRDDREAQWEYLSYFPGMKSVPQILLLTPDDGDHEHKVIGGYEDLMKYLK